MALCPCRLWHLARRCRRRHGVDAELAADAVAAGDGRFTPSLLKVGASRLTGSGVSPSAAPRSSVLRTPLEPLRVWQVQRGRGARIDSAAGTGRVASSAPRGDAAWRRPATRAAAARRAIGPPRSDAMSGTADGAELSYHHAQSSGQL